MRKLLVGLILGLVLASPTWAVTWAHVHNAATTGSTTGGAKTLTLGFTPTAGNLMVVSCTATSTDAISMSDNSTTPADVWTAVSGSTETWSTTYTSMAWATNVTVGTVPTTVTCTSVGTPSSMQIAIDEYSGGANPFTQDGTAVHTHGTGTAPAPGTYTTGPAGDLVWSFETHGSTEASVTTVASPFTIRNQWASGNYSPNTSDDGVAGGVAGSTGVNPTYTLNSTSRNWVAWVAGFEAGTTTVATPTFTYGTGTYNNTVSESISDSTSGSTICYTTDGSTPTATTPGTCSHGTSSSSPASVSITATATVLKAIGTKAGSTNSAEADATYTLTVATPTYNNDAGSYSNDVSVTISDATTSAAIVYCTDAVGTCTPVTSGSSVSITATGTYLRSKATKSSYNDSAVKSALYTLTVATPTASPVAGSYSTTQNVALSTTTTASGTTIRYTENGSTPSCPATGTLYAGTITVAATETIKAIGCNTNYVSSGVFSGTYTISQVWGAHAGGAHGAAPTTSTYTLTLGFTPAASSFLIVGCTGNNGTFSITDNSSGPADNWNVVLPKYNYDGTVKAMIAWATNVTTGTAPTTVTCTTTGTASTVGVVADNYAGGGNPFQQDGTAATANGASGATVEAAFTTGGSTGDLIWSMEAGVNGQGTLSVASPFTIRQATTGSYSVGATSDDGTASTLGATTTYTSTYTQATPAIWGVGVVGVLAASQTQASTPAFLYGTGTYHNNFAETISSSPFGVVICYTVDGSTPGAATPGTCDSSPTQTYTAPITISGTVTVKAIGTMAGFTNSSVGTAVYTMTVSQPTAVPPAGHYPAMSVTLATISTGATILYTENGSTPACPATGTTYTVPISVTTSESIKTLGCQTNYTASAVLTQAYTIGGTPLTYYIDNCVTVGNDSNDGLDPSTPWLTVAKVNGFAMFYGESFFFRRGCTWREQLTAPVSGWSGYPITFGAYGTGALPIFNASDVISAWTTDTGLYRTTSTVAIAPSQVIKDSTYLVNVALKASLVTGTWWWDAPNSYVWLYDNPATHTMEISQRSYGAFASLKNYLTFQDLELDNGNIDGLYCNTCTYATIARITAKRNFTYGILFDSTTNSTISNCTSTLNAGGGISLYGSVSHPLSYITVDGCTLNGNMVPVGNDKQWLAGIWVGGLGANNVTLQHNTIYSNGIGQLTTDFNGLGIHVDTTGSAMLLQYNLSYDNSMDGLDVENSPSAPVVRYNISYGNAVSSGWPTTYLGRGGVYFAARPVANGLVANNTAYGNNGFGVGFAGDTPTNSCLNNAAKNNLGLASVSGTNFYAIVGCDNHTGGSGNVYTYNGFGAETTNFLEWVAAGYYSTYATWEAATGNCGTTGCSHSVQGDPQFANPTAGNFNLSMTSPAIAAGTDLGYAIDYLGNPVIPGFISLGAIQYQPKPGMGVIF